ncbi:MAG: UDP-N-acetylglucosamine 1-carboxyvinyltransferase [Candidatus Gracilibacteria bacterium]|nr:UDP-N-acetylglucosamine 1-carboxyvinyltransferase [Candidatus Gracilibacteria bacterium]
MFVVNGGKKLYGNVKISGSKNACLPLLVASLLVRGKVVLKNVPYIGDVVTMLEIMGTLGVQYNFLDDTLFLDTSKLSLDNFQASRIKEIRASILLLGPILQFFNKLSIPQPGGCSIGKRPIDGHLEGLKTIGYDYKYTDDCMIEITGTKTSGDKVINAGFSVTSTENLVLANVLRNGKTIIKLAAIEPHVMSLINFLKLAGADIYVDYDHTIIIEGVGSLNNNLGYEVISDYIESGTFMIIGALLSREYIDIENARVDDLYAFIEKMREAGVKIDITGNDSVRVRRSTSLKSVSLQTNIFPGFPTDLQSPFSILLTQADGVSRIHEILFESRLNFLVEIEKVKGHIAILNPHEALIFGKTNFKSGETLTSWDLRAGVAMVILALLIEGETKITNVNYIKRGYSNFLEKIRLLGGDVVEE